MTFMIFFLGLAQCALLFILGRRGVSLASRAVQDQNQASYPPANGWPSCAMIIPLAGYHPAMENALRSLLEQDYPNYRAYLVTATADDKAVEVIKRLQPFFPLTHVVAGIARQCGQKNWNQIAGVNAVNPSAEILVFCDSTHVARPDFLRCLVGPMARGEAAFTTGYHEVEPRDQGIVTLAYTLSVLFMRLLQGTAQLTQPWGGAMGMLRQAFEKYRIADLWGTNVVDDCSLAALLRKSGIHIHLCPGALLRTVASGHSFSVWHAWMDRQILFLKFCIHGQWLALGGLCLFMAIPPLWAVVSCIDGILNMGPYDAPFLALCWFFVLCWAISRWQALVPVRTDLSHWIWAFFTAIFMFAVTYAGSLFTHALRWHGITYKVGRGGMVQDIVWPLPESGK